MHIKNRKLITALQYILISIPCVVYFAAVNRYALNIPCMDDYDAVLSFLCRYKEAQGADKFLVLFQQHNEHRILSSRIVYVLYQWLADTVNFRGLIFIGNMQLLVLLAICIHFIRQMIPRYWALASLILSVCLFDLSNWENAAFAMGAMQNFGIIMLCALCIYLYSRQGKWAPYFAMLVQIIATFSSGNGIILSAIVCLYALCSRKRTNIILSIAALLVFAPLYFVHYTNPATGHISHNISLIASYYLYLLGDITNYDSNAITICAGAVCLLVFIIVLPVRKGLKISQEAMPFLFFTLFLLTSTGVATLFRCDLGGIMIPSRYVIYPHLFVAMTIIFVLYKIKDKKTALPAGITLTLLLAIIFNINAGGGLRNLAKLNKTLKSDYYYPNRDVAISELSKACKLNIYCMDSVHFEK